MIIAINIHVSSISVQLVEVSIGAVLTALGVHVSCQWVSALGKFTLDSVRPKNERSWGERVAPNFIPTVAGQSLESHPLRASLHAASSLCLWASPPPQHLSLCVQRCHCSSLCSALLQPCSPATLSHRALGGALYTEL